MSPTRGTLLVICLAMASCRGDGNEDAIAYDCSVFPAAATSPYILPWNVGTTHLANPHAARETSPQKYALDLLMPIGTDVLAIRDGTVVRVVENFTDDDHTRGHENYVYVQHADDTVARYIHLTNNGALVAVGDAVVQGQVIGRSGDTGNSTDPHLHLDVTESCCAVPPDYNQLPEGQTRPLNFRNAAGATAAITPDMSCGLRRGERYTALPY
jgi:murein DD-endopeptidase MepM/ murein hydrolase activator NlpD